MVSEHSSNHAGVVASNVKIVAVTSVIVTILAAATRMMLPRFLGATEMGLLTFAESWSNLFLCFGQLGISAWIMKHVSVRPEEASESAASALFISAVSMMILWMVMVGGLYAGGRDIATVRLVAVVGVFVALYLTQRGPLTRLCVALGYTREISATDIWQRVVTVIAIAIALYFLPTAIGAAAALLFGQMVAFGSVILFLVSREHLNMNISVSRGFDIARQSMSFFIASVIVDVAANLDISILEHLSSPEEVGLLGAARRIQGALLIFVPALTTSFQPTLARLNSSDTAEYHRFFAQLTRVVLAFSIFVGFGMVMFGDLAVSVLYGERFGLASRSLVFLGPATILTYLAMFMGSTVILTSRGFAMAAQTIVVIAINCGLSFWLIPIGVAQGAGQGAAMTATISAVTEMIIVGGMWYILGAKLMRPGAMLHAVIWFAICLTLAFNDGAIASLSFLSRVAVFLAAYLGYAVISGLLRKEDVLTIRAMLLKRPVSR